MVELIKVPLIIRMFRTYKNAHTYISYYEYMFSKVEKLNKSICRSRLLSYFLWHYGRKGLLHIPYWLYYTVLVQYSTVYPKATPNTISTNMLQVVLLLHSSADKKGVGEEERTVLYCTVLSTTLLTLLLTASHGVCVCPCAIRKSS